MATLLSNSEPLPFYKTIRFKLTLLYSTMLFLFSGAIVLALNLYMYDYLHKDPVSKVPKVIFFQNEPPFIENFQKLQEAERARIRDLRLQDLRRIQLVSVYSVLPLALASFALGYYVSGSFLSPLNKLRADIEKIESKDLGKSFKPEADDEIGALVSSFNQMSSRLETAFKTQEQFVQNASHELRTPLTIIQTNLDTIIDNKDANKEEMRESINDALTGVRQLRKLVNYLLELTAITPKQFKKMQVNEVVKLQVDALKEQVDEKKLKILIRNEKDGAVPVLGDESLLGRVFFNLIENAIKYSTPLENGKFEPIEISYAVTQDIVQVIVINHGVEIPHEKLEKLFERFYQLDPSRNKKQGGYGLGLAIARKIVIEHGGTVFATSDKGHNAFTVTLPIAHISSKT